MEVSGTDVAQIIRCVPRLDLSKRLQRPAN